MDHDSAGWFNAFLAWLDFVPSKSRFFCRNYGALEIKDEKGDVVWKGRPDGRNVERVFEIADRTGAIVLLDSEYVDGRLQNLIRVDRRGEVVWRAALPSGQHNDAYVTAKLTRTGVVANSLSGWHVLVHTYSGAIIESEFTK